jgi:hypothetical protein
MAERIPERQPRTSRCRSQYLPLNFSLQVWVESTSASSVQSFPFLGSRVQIGTRSAKGEAWFCQIRLQQTNIWAIQDIYITREGSFSSVNKAGCLS